MSFTLERIRRITADLEPLIILRREPVSGWLYREEPQRPWVAGSTVPLVGDGSGRFAPAAGLVGSPGTYGFAAARPAAAGEDGWQPLDPERGWGGYRRHFSFEIEFQVPGWAAGEALELHLATGIDSGWNADNPQFAVYVNGELRMGFDTNHRAIRLSDAAAEGGSYRVRLEAYTANYRDRLVLNGSLVTIDRETEAFWYDLSVPLGVAELLPESDDNRGLILRTLNDCINRVDLRQAGSAASRASIREARAWLERTFYQGVCRTEQKPTVYAVGHTHIDIAWLWTLDITADKTVRTFSGMLELMRRYPDFIFMSSQPQLYRFIERFAPQLLPEIEARVAEGRWEPEGAMFVEPDCNLASGEALVRQVTTGIAYFAERFGRRPRILWLPDVFGYSAALPQILQGANIPYFMTTKISWNETNQLPMDTFTWEGIDGSTVLTHFSPSRHYIRPGEKHAWFTTYNAELGPSHVLGAWQRYQQKDINDFVLMTYGYGDGGGGPTVEMLENLKRFGRGIPGAPVVKPSTALDFFEKLEATAGASPQLPHWRGELYLELHRGTYTSMARNKKSNRRGEYGLLALETLAAIAALETGAAWPADELAEGWEILLRNQFHDILPGSSIHEVYEDSRDEYERLEALVESGITERLAALAAHCGLGQEHVIVFNPTETRGSLEVRLPENFALVSSVRDAGGRGLPVQETADGRTVFVADADGIGLAAYTVEGVVADPEAAAPVGTELGADFAAQHYKAVDPDGYVLENEGLRLVFAANGELDSIWDKDAGREVLPSGKRGNRLVIYEDRPRDWENWEISSYYREKYWPVDEVAHFRLVEDGPLFKTVEISRPCLDSLIVQRVRLASHRRGQVDFDTRIDWRNERLLLKALFPLDINATSATYEIQYGAVTRPISENTSWDQARFEVVMHKWLDVAEYGYGVSLLNDAKYGCHVRDGEVGLTLLKSGTMPNPTADQERHHFTYSLYAHAGTWQEAGTVQRANDLNRPPYTHAVCAGGTAAPAGAELPASWLLSAGDGVRIEVFKRADSDPKRWLLRAYESYGGRSEADFTFARPLVSVTPCNLLEEAIGEDIVPAGGTGQGEGGFRAGFKPWQIRSFLVTFA